ncbi:MAG: hypothetical protein NDJ94_20055 [Vicinamibacteria bacterium]|nr:hypothetical protein [Vicinamibacteria bacterium]
MEKLLRIAPAAALQERRLAELLAAGSVTVEALRAHEQQAWSGGVAVLMGEPGLAPVLATALAAVAPGATPGPEAVRAWAAALGQGGLRQAPRAGGAPPEFVAERLADLAAWMGSSGLGEVKAPARAALVFARVLDIAPLALHNDRLAHVALAHALRTQGQRLPLFEAQDAEPLAAAREAAGRLDFGPLASLLDLAAGRMLATAVRLGADPRA